MRRDPLSVAALCLCILALVLPTSARGATAPEVADLCTGETAFALDLYAKLSSQEGNLFFSPYSIQSALAMTWTGAAGETAKEMSTALHLPAMPANVEKAAAGHFEEIRRVAMAYAALQKQLSGTGAERKFQLFVANALWGQKGIPFKPAFLATVKDNFGGGLNEVDFARATEAARKTINDWVAAQTKDKIKDLIGENILSTDTVLVLTNAIYFKAAWMQPFIKQLTKKAPFYLSADAKVDADMMNLWHEFDYAEAGGAKLLLLPYEGSELSMLVILPDKREGVAEVEKSLTFENLKAWTAKLKGENVHVSLPRFKTTISFDLGEKLQALGMKRAFNSKEADFSGMTAACPLFISKVLHKAFVDVNEAGTEAAAATAVVMTKGAAPAKVVEFVADHPFIFLIKENATGCVLFMGRVVDPTK